MAARDGWHWRQLDVAPLSCLAGFDRAEAAGIPRPPAEGGAAGVDIKIVQDMLGHSSRAITSDTYTTVLPEVARAAAEAAAELLPVSL